MIKASEWKIARLLVNLFFPGHVFGIKVLTQLFLNYVSSTRADCEYVFDALGHLKFT